MVRTEWNQAAGLMTVEPASLLLFIAPTSLAAVPSAHALRTSEIYGCFRLAGFEAIARLVAWNAGRWFATPTSPKQLAS